MSGPSALDRARRLRRDRRGITIVEFALVAPALFLGIMGFFELGWRIYVASVVDGALHEAARMATVGDRTTTQVDAFVKRRLTEFNAGATITTEFSSYSEFSDVAMPERITSDTAPIGTYNATDCYEDYNNNGSWDADRGRTGFGNADDIVRYRVTIVYPRLFPLMGMLGWGNTETVTANTVLRNQPFAANSTAAPPIRGPGCT